MKSKTIATKAFQYPLSHGTYDGNIEHLSKWIMEYAVQFAIWFERQQVLDYDFTDNAEEAMIKFDNEK